MQPRPVSRHTLAAVALAVAVWAAAPAQAQSPSPPAPTAQAAYDTSRIVAAGGAITEILYALGVADRIVAVDTTSTFPPAALKTKPSIGYLRALSTEGVLSMAPSLLVASNKAGPPEVVRALKGSSVSYLEVDDDPTPRALLERVAILARAVGRVPEGERLAAEITAGFDRLAATRKAIGEPRSALFVLAVQGGRLIVGGRDTAADAMISLAGARNAVASIAGFKPLTAEAVLEANPDAIITMSHASPGRKVREELKTITGIMHTSAGRAGRIVEMDGLLLLGFGPRTPAAAEALLHAIRGEPQADGGTRRNGL